MVNKFGVLLLLLLVVVHLNRSCAEKLPTGTGPSRQLSRIAYGSEASILEHPYMVNIWLKIPVNDLIRSLNVLIKFFNRILPFLNIPIIKENEEGFQCGGTLISRKCILTAAHCVVNMKNGRLLPKEVFEFYGGNNTRKKGILLPELESVFLDGFDHETIDMDIAILKLTEPVKDPNLKTVEIDYSEVNEGDTITVTGWGRTESGSDSSTLKKTNITVTNTEDCRSLYDRIEPKWKITDNMFCGKGLRSTSDCKGDSGGPIIRNGKQIGIVSFGENNCGRVTIPGVYAKLSSVRVSEFLRQIITNNC